MAQITDIEALRFKEKVLFERKKSNDKTVSQQWLSYITLVEYDSLKKLKKKLVKLEKRYEQAVMRKGLLAKRILKSAMSVAKKIEAEGTKLVAI
jgi:hypothetical protein